MRFGPQDLRKFGPRPRRTGECLACHRPFKAGDYTTLIALGPGDREEARVDCREGRTYIAVAVEVHWACATGEEIEEARR